MKIHSTNYYDTLITVAEDSKANQGVAPLSAKGKKTIANWQFELLAEQPSSHTSDEVIFLTYAYRNELLDSEMEEAHAQFFAKGQPCLRTSPLAKTYGWGILSDAAGKVRLIDCASEEYQTLLGTDSIKKVPAMKSKK